MIGDWWVAITSAIIGAAAVVWGVIATRKSHQETRTDKQAASAIEGFAELVQALEQRLEKSYAEIERAEKALELCRGEIGSMRRTLLAFQHGGIIDDE